MGKLLQVFEQSVEYIDNDKFLRKHWRELGKYNERHGSKYFTLLPDGIRFKQYVGVIQAGNLTIEILPKIQRLDADEIENKMQWKKVLLHMLNECRYLKVAHPERASLNLRSASILDVYLLLYLEELEKLLHEGLSKRYRKVSGNRNSLKGSLQFSENLRYNLIHAERFYVRHTIYDREHHLHAILYKALTVVNKLSTGHLVKIRAGRLLLDFPEMPDVEVDEGTFRKLYLSKKEHRYEEALLIAKMILLQYRPDIAAGNDQVLALLFDMNKLWEEYVYRQLVKLEDDEFKVSRQAITGFWHLTQNKHRPRMVRPDLVIESKIKGRIVVDTKWKLMEDDEPADDDLKQMYAYGHYFDSASLYLLYPGMVKAKPDGQFAVLVKDEKEVPNKNCSLLKVPLVVEGGIRLELGKEDFI